MEGYVRLRSKFSFIKVWMVLDGQQMTYYDSLDISEQSPKNLKGIIHLKNSVVSKFSDRAKGVKHGIMLIVDKNRFSFDCDDATSCSLWFNALTRAINLYIEEEDAMLQSSKCRTILGLDLNGNLSVAEIARAYKKLCLKEHPDKGGNVENFNKINLAYNTLMALQKNADERDTSDLIHFEAIVQKGPNGGGLGLVVAEDKLRKQVVVQKVEDFTIIVGLSEEAEGEIRPGDAVIGIDKDDCSHWFLSRIRARLGAFRAPPGCQIHFTFERRVPRAELVSEDSPVVNPSSVKLRPALVEQELNQKGHNSEVNEQMQGESAPEPAMESVFFGEQNSEEKTDDSALPNNDGACASDEPFGSMEDSPVGGGSVSVEEMANSEIRELQDQLYRQFELNGALHSRVADLESLLEQAEQALQMQIREKQEQQAEIHHLNNRIASLTKIIAQNELRPPTAAMRARSEHHMKEIQRLNEKLAAAYSEIREMSVRIAQLSHRER